MASLLASPSGVQIVHEIRDKMKRPPADWQAIGGRTVMDGLCGRGLRRHASRQRQRLIRAILELDGHEDHFAVAQIFEIVHLELTLSIALMSRFTRFIGVFNRRAIVYVLAPVPA